VGSRRDRNNVLNRVVTPALSRANELRAHRDQPPVRTHLTPHTFRRIYVTVMVATGFDLRYIQAQVGHVDPSTTLGIYAQVIARSDRDQLRAELRGLFRDPRDARTARRGSKPARARRPNGPRRSVQKAPNALRRTL
jgi:integrase